MVAIRYSVAMHCFIIEYVNEIVYKQTIIINILQALKLFTLLIVAH